MTSGVPQTGFVRTSLPASAAMLVLLCGVSSTALGATESVVQRQGESRELTSLRVPQNELSASRVDHVTVDSEPVGLDTLDKTSADADNNVPLIYLTPRVANLLRSVFDTRNADTTPTERGNAPSSPLADSNDDQDSSSQRDEITSDVNGKDEILPGYQQQMYRKDI